MAIPNRRICGKGEKESRPKAAMVVRAAPNNAEPVREIEEIESFPSKNLYAI